jgi:pimeloyl-ACP methyl ester carboxylesterase
MPFVRGDNHGEIEIPDAGHILCAEQPQATNAALLDFVAQHPIDLNPRTS